MEIQFRAHTLRVLDLKTLIELKKTSEDPKDQQRLPVLKETLRQMEEKYESGEDKEDSDRQQDAEHRRREQTPGNCA